MGIFSDVLLTVDYDRTLTAPDSTIPARNLEAIRYFMENGGAFTVNTGRSVPMATAFVGKVPTNAPLLLYNGSAAYDQQTGKLSFLHPIEMDMWETVEKVMELFPELTVEVQGLDAHYNFIPDPKWDAFNTYNRCPYATVPLGTDLGPFLKFTLYGELRDVTVADLFTGSEAEIRRIDEAEQTLLRLFGDKIDISRSAPRLIDVQAKGVSKARSARELQQRLERKILVCVGDAENDIPMLDGADFAFVPADAILKERYPNVCCCAEGAVAEVIYEKIPKILNLDLDKRG